MTRRWSRLVSAAAILALPFVASGQGRNRWRDPTVATHVEQTGQFVFTRIRYGGYRSTWSHDYPRADLHLPQILDDITTIDVHLGASNVFRLDDPDVPVEPSYWGIFEANDPTQRMMAIVNYNNDIAEYWEWSDNSGYFSVDFTNDAYKLGVNYIVYGLTH